MDDSLVPDAADITNRLPTTTASVVTWNHAHCVEACIQSLLRQTCPPKEIFIYDNASADGTREVLDKFKDRVTLVYSPENKGFCGGHNFAISRTQSDFVLLVNPDVVLREDYIEKATERIAQDAKIGTVCGVLLQDGLDLKSCLIDGAGLTVARSRRFLLRFHGARASGVDLRTEEVFGCDGALPFYRRAMIENISFDGQFFDEMFFAHKEDHDVSWRGRIFGWKTVFDSDCVAMHPRVFRPGNLEVRKQLAPELKYHAVKNDLLMLLKNETAADFARDFFHIVPRRLGILVYALLRERYSLKAYWFVVRNWGRIKNARKRVQGFRVSAWQGIRTPFQGSNYTISN
ncbi:MAG TPA: glycosyltransferase family 2 protein [Verrucomicrobiae bacterium]|jgi:GT2 family glycosyltransferase|nr:glycosyltransferase family 2 protein [Verrucomicrobiae bacterium]